MKEKKLKILVVEDDLHSYLLLKTFLKNHYSYLKWAQTGREAIEEVKNTPDFDVVFMDIALPDVNGFTATQEIKKMRPDLLVIAETAHALPGDREKTLESGCDDYISKPIQKHKFFELLEKWNLYRRSDRHDLVTQ